MLGVFVSGAAYPSITTATVTNFEINNLSTNLKNITDSSIDVFPNPTNNSITITNNSKTRVTHIKLFNTNGKIISRENIQIEPREKGKIDIKKPGMTTGIYLLKIYHKDKSYIERIIYKN